MTLRGPFGEQQFGCTQHLDEPGCRFGLAMDYQLFLVSGMREAFVHGIPARESVVAGVRGGRAVVTAAAIIMASVFGGFVFSHLAGKAAWWMPRWLDRIVPDVDVEGAALERSHPVPH